MLACDPAVTDAMVLSTSSTRSISAASKPGSFVSTAASAPSYDSMRAAIVAAPSCSPVTGWNHTTSVVGAQAVFGTRNQPARRAVFGISATAAEDAVAKAGIFPVTGSKAKPKTRDIERSLASPGGVTKPVLTVLEEVKAGYTPRMELRGRLAPGHYVFAVRLTSTMNPSRSQILISKSFKVG